jgi:hypothetical protein
MDNKYIEYNNKNMYRTYDVKLTESYKIPVAAAPHQRKANTSKDDNESDMDDQYTMENYPKQIVDPPRTNDVHVRNRKLLLSELVSLSP